MALLGQLAVSIIGDTSGYSDGLSKAQRETIKFTKNIERMGRNIATVGYGFQDLGQSLTNKITKPALAAAGVVTGLVGALGFKRLIGMDNAQAKLKGLGVEGKQLEIVMEDVKGAVQGTTHTMAEGADVAAGALAAGVKEGAELERYIKLVGDAATGSNRPMADMAMIFNRVQGAGKLMTRELDMIEHGMPGFEQALAKSLGVPVDKMKEMVTEGKVSSGQFLDVMDDFAGGMSEAFAGTWQGITKNILSNIGIIGESLLSGVFDLSKEQLGEFLQVLRDSEQLKNWATETGEKIREFADTVIEKVRQMKQWWDELSPSVQGLIKNIALFGSIGAVAIGPVLLIIGKLIVTVGNLITRFGVIAGAITKLGGLWGILTGPIGIVIGSIAALITTGVLLYKNWDTIKAKAEQIFPKFEPLIDTVKNAFQNLKDSAEPILESLKRLWESLIPIFRTAGVIVGASLVPAFGLVVSVFSAVVSAIGPVINAIVNLVDMFVNMANAVIAIFKGDFSEAMDFWKDATESSVEFVKNLWDGIVSFFSTFIETIIDFFKGLYNTLVGNSIIPDMVNGIIKWFGKLPGELLSIAVRMVSNVVKKFVELKDNAQNKINEAKTAVINKFQEIVRGVTNKASEIVSNVSTKFNEAKEKITKPIEDAKATVRGIIDDIKGFFSGLKLELPEIKVPSLPKLPQPKISGSFSLRPPSVPKISWNAMGGIFKNPTIFNTANAGLQGVGEAGAEAIIPLNNKNLGVIGEMIARTMPNNNDASLTRVMLEQNQILMKILEKDPNLYIGTEKLGEVMDREQAKRVNLTGRVAY